MISGAVNPIRARERAVSTSGKEMRIAAGLTQAALATRLDRPRSFVAKYEGGERRVDVIEFIEIAGAIGFDPTEFIKEFVSAGQEPHDASAPCGKDVGLP